MGKNFEEERDAHNDKPFSTSNLALDWAKLNLEPGQKFWICDENGGICISSHVPQIVGNA